MGRLIDVDILIAELKESALHHCNNPREDSLLQRDRVIARAQPTVKAIPIEQLEEMYVKFQQKLWREHEDVRGDDMIEVGYAEEFLQELLMEFGCWDGEVEK